MCPPSNHAAQGPSPSVLTNTGCRQSVQFLPICQWKTPWLTLPLPAEAQKPLLHLLISCAHFFHFWAFVSSCWSVDALYIFQMWILHLFYGLHVFLPRLVSIFTLFGVCPRAEADSFHAADLTVFLFWASERRIKLDNIFLTICAVLIFMFSFWPI